MDESRRILALETSGRHGSVATLWGHPEGTESIGQISLTPDQRTAQALAPAIRQLLSNTGWPPASINYVAVAIGPGSFTGLRIGVTTAKVFAYAISAEVIAVNTLDVLATQAAASAKPLWTIMDAQRQELFAAKYVTESDGQFAVERPTHIISQDAWLADLQTDDCVTGPALNRLATRLPTGIATTSSELWQPMADAVGQVAWRIYRAGQRDDIWRLSPNYYRASAAEEKNPL